MVIIIKGSENHGFDGHAFDQILLRSACHTRRRRLLTGLTPYTSIFASDGTWHPGCQPNLCYYASRSPFWRASPSITRAPGQICDSHRAHYCACSSPDCVVSPTYYCPVYLFSYSEMRYRQRNQNCSDLHPRHHPDLHDKGFGQLDLLASSWDGLGTYEARPHWFLLSMATTCTMLFYWTPVVAACRNFLGVGCTSQQGWF